MDSYVRSLSHTVSLGTNIRCKSCRKTGDTRRCCEHGLCGYIRDKLGTGNGSDIIGHGNFLRPTSTLNLPNIATPPPPTSPTTAMAAPRSLTALARPLASAHLTAASRQRLAAFSTSAPRSVTTSGAPTPNFRVQRPRKWNEQKESVWDQAGNYFLLTEMMRGMYVVLEQFFRPP